MSVHSTGADAEPARYDGGMRNVLEAIDRGAVLGILGAADTVLATKQLAERQGKALEEIRGVAEYWRDNPHFGLEIQQGARRILRAIDEAGA